MGIRAGAVGAGLALISVLAAGCTDRTKTTDSRVTEEPAPPGGNEVPSETPPVPSDDAGTPPSSTGGDDAGTPPVTPPPTDTDAGTPDAGPPQQSAGPWPSDAVLDYTHAFGVGKPQSVGLDEGLNLWLLDGDRIGVLRPGDAAPKWTRGIGQASKPFGWDSLAIDSTVICGGAAGRAYVGYRAAEMQHADGIFQRTYIPGPGEAYYSPERYAEYQKGDLDVVKLQPDGSVALEEHMWRTTGLSNKDRHIGIHNTNDFHYEEDRTVLNCARVTRGAYKGDVYITTNHGATRIQGLTYNSHRHPGWYLYENGSEYGSLQVEQMYGLGIAPNGDVLVANEQMLGVLVPSAKLEEWDRENTWEGPVPWRYKGFNEKLNSLEAYDYWRAFEQVKSGRYYLGSAAYGVWAMTLKSRSAGNWSQLSGLPTSNILSLKATDDGALYIGTDGAGLWRLEPDGATLNPVKQVSGRRVLQLVYEPAVTPSMLLVLTDQGLTVLRGP